MKLADILNLKGWGTVMVHESITIEIAVKILCDHRIGSLIVQGKDGSLVGLLTETEILRHFSDQGVLIAQLTVGDIMLKHVAMASADMPVENATRFMMERRLRHLPVIKDGSIVGIVSLGDIVKALLSQTSAVTDIMENYITYA
jgi:CBS domain-containing protein